jgi:ribose transport system permease protein
MFSIAFGCSQILTDGGDLRGVPLNLTRAITYPVFAGTPLLFVIAVGVCLAAGLVLAFTSFGRHTYAVGSSAEAARRAGIDVEAQLIRVYALSGALTGLAGFLFVARFTTTSLASNGAFTLQVLTAVALGGTSFFGGSGTILGSAFGVFIPVLLHNGLVIAGLQPYWQQVVAGMILISAVLLDRIRRMDLTGRASAPADEPVEDSLQPGD